MNEHEITIGMQAFAALLGRTPQEDDFARKGWLPLLDAIVETGGLRKWQHKLGMIPRAAAVTPAEILRDLRLYLNGKDGWPSRSQFDADGYGTLWTNMYRNGGIEFWATMVGRTVNRSGRPAVGKGNGKTLTKWTYDLIRKELRVFLDGRTEWPTTAQFRDAGLQNLLQALKTHGGAKFWAGEFGMTARESSRKRTNTHAHIANELLVFCEGRTEWPGHNEFRKHRRYALLKAVVDNGGASYWATRMGFPDPAGRVGGARKTWTHGRILAELGEFVIGRTEFPTGPEFIDAGKSGLYSAISNNGGGAYWAPRVGLVAPRRGRRKAVAA